MDKGSKIYRIPVNYSGGVSFLGMLFPSRNLLETIGCFAVLCPLELAILRGKSLTVLVSALLCTAVLCGAAVLPGADGDSLFRYLRLLIRFKRRNRLSETSVPKQGKSESVKAVKPQTPAKEKKTSRKETRKGKRSPQDDDDIMPGLVIPMMRDYEEKR